MKTSLIIIFTKLINFIIQAFNLGHGGTWPGHIALMANKSVLKTVFDKNKNINIILVAGTNGKTTTTLLLKHILEKSGQRVFINESGANLLNGITSSVLLKSSLFGKLNYDYAILEVDENSLEGVIENVNPNAILLLNLFRDQLDRYGEVNTISKKWQNVLKKLSNKTTLFANSDDPEIVHIAQSAKLKTEFFCIDRGLLKKKELSHDVDSIYCPLCQTRLNYDGVAYSHLGEYKCTKCRFKNPKCTNFPNLYLPLEGTYNIYNTTAAAIVANKVLDISLNDINKHLKDFKPAFGRQEKLVYKHKKITLLLSKNPTGFNQSIQTVLEKAESSDSLLILLNDRIPDGRDISWIWDVDFEDLKDKFEQIALSGDRAYDLGVRFKYAEIRNRLFTDPNEALDEIAKKPVSKLHILATYSAMLEIREKISGRKIL